MRNGKHPRSVRRIAEGRSIDGGMLLLSVERPPMILFENVGVYAACIK
jgi:hypothetical protein